MVPSSSDIYFTALLHACEIIDAKWLDVRDNKCLYMQAFGRSISLRNKNHHGVILKRIFQMHGRQN